MPDRYAHLAVSSDSPAVHAFAVTPDDETALPETTRALYVGTGGTVAVVLRSGAEVTLAGAQGGAILPIRVTHVKATGTTASQLVALV